MHGTLLNHDDGFDESNGSTRTRQWRRHATAAAAAAQCHLARTHAGLDDKRGAAALKHGRVLDGEIIIACQTEQNAARGARGTVVTDDFERGLTHEQGHGILVKMKSRIFVLACKEIT